MNDRRPLTSTLPNIDPELARAFVTQEPKTIAAVERTIRLETPMARSTSDTPRKPIRKSKPHGVTPVGLIPVTVRLRPEIAGALKRASLERQLAGEATFTQQDLVEQLLEPWLRDHGFLA
jgi:hypothetical protein